MGVEWGGKRVAQPEPSESHTPRHIRGVGLKGMLDVAMHRIETPTASDIPDAEKIGRTERIIDYLSESGRIHGEMRDALGEINRPNPLDQARRQ